MYTYAILSLLAVCVLAQPPSGWENDGNAFPQWANAHPLNALSYLNSNPSGIQQWASRYPGQASALAQAHPMAASRFVNSNPSFASNWANSHPNEAVAWAHRNPTQYSQLGQQHPNEFRSFAQRNPTQFNQWGQQHPNEFRQAGFDKWGNNVKGWSQNDGDMWCFVNCKLPYVVFVVSCWKEEGELGRLSDNSCFYAFQSLLFLRDSCVVLEMVADSLSLCMEWQETNNFVSLIICADLNFVAYSNFGSLWDEFVDQWVCCLIFCLVLCLVLEFFSC